MKQPFRILRTGKALSMPITVIEPLLGVQVAETLRPALGFSVVETTEGPALAITLQSAKPTLITGIITPADIGQAMEMLNESAQRLAAQLIPAEGDPQ